ncbi:MAG: sugar transferase [Burkholderiales bacterium PBB5]|nr:MAG: sugar transferase [Burkholderiales bacterium PBB5]
MGAASADPRPLVVHLVYRFDTGGLENGIVNLINHMPAQAFRHAVVALTDVVPAFAQRIQRHDVQFASLHKPPGQAFQVYGPLLDLLRRWQPAVLHTRNLAALECQPAGAWARVPVRIHGEHGRDSDDPQGLRKRQQWIRRLYAPFVHHHIALSRDLSDYLTQRVRLPASRVSQIYNGVDIARFAPAPGGRQMLPGCPFNDPGLQLVGTVGRMSTVKAQPLLAQAFVAALQRQPDLRRRLRLVMVGDGPLRAEAQAVLQAGGVADLAWLPGERQDVPDVMRGLDAFVLPSLAEGISNTILEAMATGLPVLATQVGGNADLVDDAQTGWLVPAGDVPALAEGLLKLACDPMRAQGMGRLGRKRVEAHFSLPAMVASYQSLYQRLLDVRRA